MGQLSTLMFFQSVQMPPPPPHPRFSRLAKNSKVFDESFACFLFLLSLSLACTHTSAIVYCGDDLACSAFGDDCLSQGSALLDGQARVCVRVCVSVCVCVCVCVRGGMRVRA